MGNYTCICLQAQDTSILAPTSTRLTLISFSVIGLKKEKKERKWLPNVKTEWCFFLVGHLSWAYLLSSHALQRGTPEWFTRTVLHHLLLLLLTKCPCISWAWGDICWSAEVTLRASQTAVSIQPINSDLCLLSIRAPGVVPSHGAAWGYLTFFLLCSKVCSSGALLRVVLVLLNSCGFQVKPEVSNNQPLILS